MSCFQLSITCSLYHRNGQGGMGEGEEVGGGGGGGGGRGRKWEQGQLRATITCVL